ncbi:MAG TPA: DUF4157 domain-containing protein [Saprospiraceae bacterium]|nr:DUF4157 domain-containing protein [Saprospiraceae bacterium]
MFAYKQSGQSASKTAQYNQQVHVPFFQPKLTVNQPGDEYEQEADRVADQVMRMPGVSLFGGGKGEAIQRSKMEEEEHLQRKEKPVPHFLGSEPVVVQRKCAECEKEEKEGVQRKESGGDAGGKAAPSIVSDVLSSGGGQALDANTKGFMESRFGQDFSHVRVHTDARAAESAQAIQARAYTSGKDVVFGAGEYQPESESGKKLLAHELVHVGQQESVNRKMVQRTIGDGHDLTSPRFAGDPTLEACFDDQARLAKNARGESVRKIQQALIDLGFDLGPTGVDGEYGDFTSNAVKKFKRDQKLGFEQFGDVGPGTIARLDEMFSQAPPIEPPPRLEDDDSLGCPTPDVVVAELTAQPILTNAFVSANQNEHIVGTSSLNTAISASDPLQDAVDKFKSKVNVQTNDSSPNISSWGQFFWTGRILTAIKGEANRLKAKNGDPDAIAFGIKADLAATAIMQREKKVFTLLGALDVLAAKTKSPEKKAMLALLKSSASGGAIDTSLWAALNLRPDNSLPEVLINQHRSLRDLHAILSFDSSKCGTHAFQVAALLHKKGGMVPLSQKPFKFSAHLAAGGAIRDLRPVGDNDHMRGDVIFQTGVAKAVDNIKNALNTGMVVHARVLSGVGYGGSLGNANPNSKAIRLSAAPPEEHSLLIIGHDGNSTFVFHDPDAGVSHDPETGFGKLHHDASTGRLTTAINDTDIVVDANGKHLSHNKRYQIISLSTV